MGGPVTTFTAGQMIWYAPEGWAWRRYGKLVESVLDRPSPVLERMRLEAEERARAREPLPIEEATYEQWIGLLYACAVFRGVLSHPVPWPYDPIGYVARVGD